MVSLRLRRDVYQGGLWKGIEKTGKTLGSCPFDVVVEARWQARGHGHTHPDSSCNLA